MVRVKVTSKGYVHIYCRKKNLDKRSLRQIFPVLRYFMHVLVNFPRRNFLAPFQIIRGKKGTTFWLGYFNSIHKISPVLVTSLSSFIEKEKVCYYFYIGDI